MILKPVPEVPSSRFLAGAFLVAGFLVAFLLAFVAAFLAVAFSLVFPVGAAVLVVFFAADFLVAMLKNPFRSQTNLCIKSMDLPLTRIPFSQEI
jgi:Na+/glutamate symporter